MYQEAVKIQERLAPVSLAVAETYKDIGNKLYEQDNLEGAMNEFQKALMIQEHLAPTELSEAAYSTSATLVEDEEMWAVLRMLWHCKNKWHFQICHFYTTKLEKYFKIKGIIKKPCYNIKKLW